MRLRATIETAISASLLGFFRWFEAPAEPVLRLCGFYWLTSLPCPLCGMTRGLCAAAKGHWEEAFAFHAFSPLALAVLIGWLVVALIRMGRPFAPIRIPWRATGVTLLSYGAVRVLVLTL